MYFSLHFVKVLAEVTESNIFIYLKKIKSVVPDTHDALPMNMVSEQIFSQEASLAESRQLEEVENHLYNSKGSPDTGFLSCCAHLIKNHEDHLAKSGFEDK